MEQKSEPLTEGQTRHFAMGRVECQKLLAELYSLRLEETKVQGDLRISFREFQD